MPGGSYELTQQFGLQDHGLFSLVTDCCMISSYNIPNFLRNLSEDKTDPEFICFYHSHYVAQGIWNILH